MEQKRCRKETRGIEELQYIDNYIFKDIKTKQKKVAMTWIDNKKAYDMVLQNWIIYCLKMCKIYGEVIKFIENTIENWRVELTVGRKSLTEVKIQGGSFPKDAQ